MSKTIYLAFVHDRKNKAGRDKEAAVEIRLTQNRRSVYYNTGVRIKKKHWHRDQVVNRLDAAEIQTQLDRAMKRTRQAINALEENGYCDAREVLAYLRRQEGKTLSFLDFCMERAAIRTHDRADDTRERYERFMRFMLKYGKIMTFADITDKAIVELDEYLAPRMKPYSKWNNYHRFLNSFILDAIAEGRLSRNPYKQVHIEKEKSNGGIGKYLTMEEFTLLRDCELPTECLQRVRDLFVFQTYTCLSYVDMKSFDANHIYYIKGRPVYTAKRGKTKQDFTFMLMPGAIKILEKYDYHLPLISNVKYNQYLKVLAQSAKIDKPISSHWARHTGATMLLNDGHLEMEVVAKVLGHSSTKITRQVYAKLLDETVVDAMSSMKC